MGKKIKDSGIVLSVEYKEESAQWTNNQGKIVQGQPERTIITVACGEINKDTGIEEMALVNFVVTPDIGKNFKFLEEVIAKYEYNGKGSYNKPIEILKNKKGA
jgi:hypothetical protein